jgi:hypothetical protein
MQEARSDRDSLRSMPASIFVAVALCTLAACASGKSSPKGNPASDDADNAAADTRGGSPNPNVTRPDPSEKRGAEMNPKDGFFGVELGMDHAKCVEVAKSSCELRLETEPTIEMTGTWAEQPVEMVWTFRDGKLTNVSTHFLSQHGPVSLADAPLHATLVDRLGPPTDRGSTSRKEWVSWSAGNTRTELAQHKIATPGRGVHVEYWIHLSTARSPTR